MDGTSEYCWGRGMACLLDRFLESQDWQEELFPPQASFTGKQQAIDGFIENLKSCNLTTKLDDLVGLTQDEASGLAREARRTFITADEESTLARKLKIETDPESFPFEYGWTYLVKTHEPLLFPIPLDSK